MADTMVEVVCNYCNEKFLRNIGFVNRSKKNNAPMYCSRSCMGKNNGNKNLRKYHKENAKKLKQYLLDNHGANRRPKKSDATTRCDFCEKEFISKRWKIERKKRDNCNHYCSRSCYCKHISELYTCEDSMFRDYLRRSKNGAKKRKIEHNIDIDDLLQVWENQQGVCPYTGWEMLNINKNGRGKKRDKYYRHYKLASLDRIDNNKGYVKENIQFVCLIAQIAKKYIQRRTTNRILQSSSNKMYALRAALGRPCHGQAKQPVLAVRSKVDHAVG